ncbi:hypothetical protein LINGRAHAP2_LOCUS24262, partial [Linum grandiflorum]
IFFKIDVIQLFIKNYNAEEPELTITEGKVLRFTEEDVERICGLYRDAARVTDFIENNEIDDLQIWASDLKLPCISKGNLNLSMMETWLATKEDDDSCYSFCA